MIVGLTGGIASGKTFCADFFQAHGVPVVDADKLAREVVQKGSPLLAQLVTTFGAEVLLPDGNLNRAWLREQMFADEAVKRAVNALMHPAIRHRAEQALAEAQLQAAWVLYVVPLLFENQLDSACDAVIVVDVMPELQLSRGVARDGVSEEQMRSIMAAQSSREEKLSRAHFVIDNSGSQAQTQQQCQHLLAHLSFLLQSLAVTHES